MCPGPSTACRERKMTGTRGDNLRPPNTNFERSAEGERVNISQFVEWVIFSVGNQKLNCHEVNMK